jgi:iron complex outermembrane receptor protein
MFQATLHERKITMKKGILLATAAIGFALVTNPAFAQDTAAQDATAQDSAADQSSAADAGDSGAIIVTARRRAEDVSKVPIAITAFSGEQLVTKGVQNTLELTKITPGLNIQAAGSRANPFIVIRGQSKAVTGNGSPGVITYMNDVPLPTYGSLIQSYDMENIQVLKGPQGTLFGRNSIGGAVLTVTKAPTHEFGGYFVTDVAQYNNLNIEGGINVPIVQDKIALRVSGQLSNQNGNVKTFLYSQYGINNGVITPGSLVPSNRDADEFNARSVRASLLIEPTDWLKNVTVADYSKIRGGPAFIFANFPGGLYSQKPSDIYAALSRGSTDPATLAFADFYANTVIPALAQCSTNDIRCNVFTASAAAQNSIKDRVSYTTQDPWLARTIVKGVSNTTTIRLGENHQLKNIFGYRSTDAFTNVSTSGLAVPIISSPATTRLQQITDELQLSGSLLNDDLKYTVGGFYYKEKPNGPGGYQALEVNTFFGLSHTFSTTYLKNSSKAVYGQIDYSLGRFLDGLTLTAGVRQTWDRQSVCTTSATLSPLAPALLMTTARSASIPTEEQCRAGVGPNIDVAETFDAAKFKKLTYTLGLNWQITPSAMVYGVHRRGYRGGGYNTPTFDPYLANVQTFQPETLEDFEIGTKLRFNSGGIRGTLDLAAFTGKDKGNQLPLDASGLAAGVCVVGATPTASCTGGAGLVRVNATSIIANAATLTIRGFEAAGSLTPFEGLTLSGSAAYVDVKVDAITLPANLVNFLTAAGRQSPTNIQIQGQPTWSANAGISAVYPEKVFGGELNAAVDFHYTGSTRQVELTIPSYTSLDLRIGLDNIQDTGISLAAYVRNLTNEAIYTGAGSSNLSLGVTSYQLGNPRLFGMQLRYAFGGR